MQVQDLSDEGTWTVFVETLNPESNAQRLPHFDKDSKFTCYLCELLGLNNISFVIKLLAYEIKLKG